AQEQWKFDVAEKQWGLQVKSVTCSTVGEEQTYTLLVEFTRDLREDELARLNEDFPAKGDSKSLTFVYFDKDSVPLVKRADFRVTSELTGVKGDAFRLVVPAPAKNAEDAVKAELRAR